MSIASFAAAGGQGGQQLGSALAPLAMTTPSHAMSLAPRGVTAAYGHYGLSMRFVVRVHGFEGVDSLGEWSACRGLKVDFRTQPVDDGGESRGLPTQVIYSPVVLERAVEQASSRQLQTWLGRIVTAWRDAPTKPTGTVDIDLYDAQAVRVASWSLRAAYPVSWSGPVMDAHQNAVAVETLTFEHEGFLETADAGTAAGGRPAAATAGAPSKTTEEAGRARLEPEESGEGGVRFSYNPSTIVLEHAAPVVSSAGIRRAGGHTVSGPKDTADLPAADQLERARATTRITLRALTLEGQDVEGACRRLLLWSRFGAVAEDAKSTRRTGLPRLKFIWGPHRYLVHLTRVTISYTRFGEDGRPIRAVADLTLHAVPNDLRPTNPSSGGLPGRRTHLLAGAETLPGLATRTYGGPGRWREIAAANGFDDPLRVRPGTLVYLPSAREDAR